MSATGQELADIRGNHYPHHYLWNDDEQACCPRCWRPWPCDAARLADEVERRQLGAGSSAASTAAACRDLEAAERERDAARAEATRLRALETVAHHARLLIEHASRLWRVGETLDEPEAHRLYSVSGLFLHGLEARLRELEGLEQTEVGGGDDGAE